MSNYKNFIQDFPQRCGSILDGYKDQAKKSGLEVTHMLAIASAAITIPFERFRKPKHKRKHPSNEREMYHSATNKFANFCDKEFLKSSLWENETNNWYYGIIKEKKLNDQPESWIAKAKKLPSDFKIIYLLNHIRNSISHSSIYASSDEKDNIDNLILLNKFLEKGKFNGDYSYVKVSVTDFNKFLINWIKFLSDEIKLNNK